MKPHRIAFSLLLIISSLTIAVGVSAQQPANPPAKQEPSNAQTPATSAADQKPGVTQTPAPLTISNETLKNGIVSVGKLPDGLNLSAIGAITGNPTKAGSFDFTAQVTDDKKSSASQQFTIIIEPQSSIT